MRPSKGRNGCTCPGAIEVLVGTRDGSGLLDDGFGLTPERRTRNWVVVDQFLHHDSDLRALSAQGGELLSQAREDRRCGVSADHHDRLLAQRLGDFLGQAASHPRGQLQQPSRHSSGTGRLHRGRRRVMLEQVQHRGVVEVWAHDPLQRGVDLGQKAADPVARCRHLAKDVVVEAAEHRQLGNGFVG